MLTPRSLTSAILPVMLPGIFRVLRSGPSCTAHVWRDVDSPLLAVHRAVQNRTVALAKKRIDLPATCLQPRTYGSRARCRDLTDELRSRRIPEFGVTRMREPGVGPAVEATRAMSMTLAFDRQRPSVIVQCRGCLKRSGFASGGCTSWFNGTNARAEDRLAQYWPLVDRGGGWGFFWKDQRGRDQPTSNIGLMVDPCG